MHPKPSVDQVFDPEDQESSSTSESEQAPAVPQTDIGKEPAPQVSDTASEGVDRVETTK